MDPRSYLEAIKLKIATSARVKQVDIVQERISGDQGYFRARLVLANDDFLEVSEFFESEQGKVQTVEYRHQWMDSSRQILRKRWDNARHYSGLPNFPHHVHIGSEDLVEPGRPIGIIELIEMLEREVGG